MYTSYFGNLQNIPAELRTVGIARGVPKFYKGESDRRLAPTWAMLKMAKPDYDQHFAAILAKLNPREIYESLGENAVLLCWEKPNEWCHRRAVAEWLEQALGVEIPELGLSRSDVVSYNAMSAAPPKQRKSRPKLFGLW